GDVITAVNGVRVSDPNTLRNRIASAGPGADVTLKIMRDGKEQELHAKLAELPADQASADMSAPGGTGGGQLGISVQPLTPDLASQLGVQRGTQGLVV